jgi:hypothetical protein
VTLLELIDRLRQLLVLATAPARGTVYHHARKRSELHRDLREMRDALIDIRTRPTTT